MRKFILPTFFLVLSTLSQFALAQTNEFGIPISATVIVLFPDSSATFKPNAEQIDLLADAKGAALVTIRGRTSTTMPTKKDESLALNRALSARSYLVARGVSPLKIVVNFASAAEFVSNNSMPEGRHKNHCVEVELIYVTSLSN